MSRFYQTKSYLIDLAEIAAIGEIYNEAQWLIGRDQASFEIVLKHGPTLRQYMSVSRRTILTHPDGKRVLLFGGETIVVKNPDKPEFTEEIEYDLEPIKHERNNLIAAWKEYND